LGLAPLYLYSVMSSVAPICNVLSAGCVIVYSPLLSLLSVNFIRVSAPVGILFTFCIPFIFNAKNIFCPTNASFSSSVISFKSNHNLNL